MNHLTPRFLKSLRNSNPDKLVFAHLNINSIRKKFEMLSDEIKSYIAVLLVSETKINMVFLMDFFLIDGFSRPHRLDRNSMAVDLCYLSDKIFLQN